ncbi:MAG: hypothetical protein ACE5JG_02045 [Planctomycetota bacterium]
MSGAADLLAALTPVVEALDRLGIEYQLGGSVASSVHGTARSTLDIDLVADLREDQTDLLVRALAADYYVDAGMIREAIRDRSSFNVIHQGSMLKVDVFIPRDRPYDREALRRRRPDRLEGPEGARQFFVATPEDVILAKLEWYDRGGRASERQWSDVLGILRVQGDIDEAYLRKWAPELGVGDLVDRALEER